MAAPVHQVQGDDQVGHGPDPRQDRRVRGMPGMGSLIAQQVLHPALINLAVVGVHRHHLPFGQCRRAPGVHQGRYAIFPGHQGQVAGGRTHLGQQGGYPGQHRGQLRRGPGNHQHHPGRHFGQAAPGAQRRPAPRPPRASRCGRSGAPGPRRRPPPCPGGAPGIIGRQQVAGLHHQEVSLGILDPLHTMGAAAMGL